MFKRMSEEKVIAELRARIKELEKERDEWQGWYYELDADYDTLASNYDELQEAYDELEEQATEYMEQLKYQAQDLREELDSKDAYIEELEEALYEANPNHILVRGMEREEDAIEVEYRVKADEGSEQSLLNAPIDVNEVSKRVEIEARIRRARNKVRKLAKKFANKSDKAGRIII